MFKTLKADFPASVVVFFVALPLCLGIALASGAPLFSGLIAGIIGGIVVGAISGSHVGVSGPAAGLAAIVLTAISTLGDYRIFLVAVVIAGALQVILGLLKAGIIGYFFPSSVIKGMLTGIGIIIILKQIPHFFGYDSDWVGDLTFIEKDGSNTFGSLFTALRHISPGATIIAVLGLSLMLFWDKVLAKKARFFTIIQGPIVAVAIGIAYAIATKDYTYWSIEPEHLVSVPVFESFADFTSQFTSPAFSSISNKQVWIVGFTIALVASLETLLSVEATDKLDPHKRVTPTNRELVAQGVGNIVSGMIGGLPITQVIVRSSANIQSKNETKLSAIIHGFLLLIAVILLPRIINEIPLSVLAAVLILVGYKLAKPSLFKKMFQLGTKQFAPFIITVLGIIFTDLLIGISLGLGVGVLVILYYSFKNSHFLHLEDESAETPSFKMTLAEEVTFFNKGAILDALEHLPKNSTVEIDVRKTRYLDYDIVEIIQDFGHKAKERNISLTVISERGVVGDLGNLVTFFTHPRR
ncbi:MAG: SulP family inorganic anion transporter [Flavobacteriaceae bacterium]|nr:SulP family inorganic anion transporter [Flavobacteriaceae bacterium]